VLALAARAGVADYKTSKSTISTTEALTPGGGRGLDNSPRLGPLRRVVNCGRGQHSSVTINAATLVDSYYPNAGSSSTNVAEYDPISGSLNASFMTNIGFIVVGAGVSTCAPLVQPMPR
jgi:hypothetical protein